ncbi:MAG: KamA family radical SAM protein [bacterium]
MTFQSSTQRSYRAYNLRTFRSLPQMALLSEEEKFAIEVVANVLPFKTNSYVIEELIDWRRVPDDPIFRLTFPHKNMLATHHFRRMAEALKAHKGRAEIDRIANDIRQQLNPHPAGQLQFNIPSLNGKRLTGLQHKYKETVLFFPAQSQTCHAYCAFCFRWPQFAGMAGLKFAAREVEQLIGYLEFHPEVTDVLFTGGDPMIMKTQVLNAYVKPLLQGKIPTLKSIRIGTKSLAFWPYRFLDGPEADQTLDLFREITSSGLHLSFMAHFSHPRELETRAVQDAIMRIRETGAQIRTQSPVLRHINDRPRVWSKMWQKQVQLGCVPYYMFVVRDTGARDYFAVPLVEAWRIFTEAYRNVSGLARTVRGPSMSATEGKIQILGVTELFGEKVIGLTMLQARKDESVMRPFFARYDESALWIDDLELISDIPVDKNLKLPAESLAA